MQNKQYASTSPPDYKSTAQANMSNNSNVVAEPSDLVTTNYDSTSDTTEVTDVNSTLEAALVQL